MQTVIRIVSSTFLLLLPALVAAQDVDYDPVVRDALRQSPGTGALNFRILVDAANLGGEETRIAELTLSPDYVGQAHSHDTIEIFYVLSGRFGHNVNGEMSVLEPGEVAIYRPGDTIIHSVEGDEPVVVLAIWLPGGAPAPFHGP